jgi:2-keto-4-pentenoate hydratase
MTLNDAERTLADLIIQHRADKTTTPGKDDSRGVDLAGAYRIQAANQGDRELKGYKFGLISPAKQEQMGISQALTGPIYADMLQSDTVSLGDFIAPRLEPEVAVVLRDDLSAEATVGAAAQAVGGYFLGVDILDSIWEGYKFTAPEVVADNTSGGGFLLGEQMSPTVPGGTLRMFLNGELQVEGHLSVLGNPVQSLQWLARTLGGLDAGMIIFFGSPAASIPAKPGILEVADSAGNILTAKIVE